jgi:hypothetical protein
MPGASSIVVLLVVLVLGAEGPPAKSRVAQPAGCHPVASSDVWLSKTGGSWQDGAKYGYYRALAIRKGLEHATDWVQIQILEAHEKSNSVQPKLCADLDTPGLKGYVVDFVFSKLSDKRVALGIDIRMKSMHDIVLREVLLVDHDGKATRLVEAKPVEIE